MGNERHCQQQEHRRLVQGSCLWLESDLSNRGMLRARAGGPMRSSQITAEGNWLRIPWDLRTEDLGGILLTQRVLTTFSILYDFSTLVYQAIDE
jgi:hypothetical protein